MSISNENRNYIIKNLQDYAMIAYLEELCEESHFKEIEYSQLENYTFGSFLIKYLFRTSNPCILSERGCNYC